MGINPAMGMGYGFGGDDFYTQMLYQQMANGGAANSSIWNNAGTNNATAGGGGLPLQVKKLLSKDQVLAKL